MYNRQHQRPARTPNNKQSIHASRHTKGKPITDKDGRVYYFSPYRAPVEYKESLAYSFLYNSVLNSSLTVDIYSPKERHNILYPVLLEASYATDMIGKDCVFSVQAFKDGTKIAIARYALFASDIVD